MAVERAGERARFTPEYLQGSIPWAATITGSLAQLAERLLDTQEGAGAEPARPTILSQSDLA